MNQVVKIGIYKPWVLLAVVTWFLLCSAVQAAEKGATNSAHSAVWQTLISELPQDKGVFNHALRQAVRDTLELPRFSADEALDPQISQALTERLQQLDRGLQKYVRVSNTLKSYQQLEKLMPALYAIEESRLITALFKQQNAALPRLRNSRLSRFLNQRIEQLANNMIFNMKALVRERRPYEAHLLQAMASYGVEYSAKPPDFILDYAIEFTEMSAQGEWMFATRIALLNQYETPIVKVEELIVTQAEDESSALKNGLEVMAKLITMQLRMHFIKQNPAK